MLDTRGMIDVSGVNLEELINATYELSSPQGMGFLHAKVGGLDQSEVDEIVERGKADNRIVIDMDYVNGRACKMTVFKTDEGSLFIRNKWFDHSDLSLTTLLERVGISAELIERARSEETSLREDQKLKAMSELKSNGGVISNYNDLDIDTQTGLYIAQSDGLAKHDWGAGVWSLVTAEAI